MKELLQGTQSQYAEYRMKAKPPLLLTIAVAVSIQKENEESTILKTWATLSAALRDIHAGCIRPISHGSRSNRLTGCETR